MKKLIILIFAFTSNFVISAQQNDSLDFAADNAEVKIVVEKFLTAAGNYDFEAMPALFSKNANIGGVSLKNGNWNTYTTSFENFIEHLKSDSKPSKYTEPVSKFTIHMEAGMLAFVKADAVLIRNDIKQSNNFDFFTLIKENGDWKILNGSYVSIPIEK